MKGRARETTRSHVRRSANAQRTAASAVADVASGISGWRTASLVGDKGIGFWQGLGQKHGLGFRQGQDDRDQAPSTKGQSSNIKLQTSSAKHRTSNIEHQAPHRFGQAMRSGPWGQSDNCQCQSPGTPCHAVPRHGMRCHQPKRSAPNRQNRSQPRTHFGNWQRQSVR